MRRRVAVARNLAKAWLILLVPAGLDGLRRLEARRLPPGAALRRLGRAARRGAVLVRGPDRDGHGRGARAPGRRGAGAALRGRGPRGSRARDAAAAVPPARRVPPSAVRRPRRAGRRCAGGLDRAARRRDAGGARGHRRARARAPALSRRARADGRGHHRARRSSSRRGSAAGSQRSLLVVLGPLAASFVHLVLSPKREFEADRFAAELCASPHGLADALLRLEQHDGARCVRGQPGDGTALRHEPVRRTRDSRRSS